MTREQPPTLEHIGDFPLEYWREIIFDYRLIKQKVSLSLEEGSGMFSIQSEHMLEPNKKTKLWFNNGGKAVETEALVIDIKGGYILLEVTDHIFFYVIARPLSNQVFNDRTAYKYQRVDFNAVNSGFEGGVVPRRLFQLLPNDCFGIPDLEGVLVDEFFSADFTDQKGKNSKLFYTPFFSKEGADIWPRVEYTFQIEATAAPDGTGRNFFVGGVSLGDIEMTEYKQLPKVRLELLGELHLEKGETRKLYGMNKVGYSPGGFAGYLLGTKTTGDAVTMTLSVTPVELP